MGTFYNRQLQTDRRRDLRNNATNAEQLLWMYLKGSQLKEKFRRQFGVGPYVIDFYCCRLRLAIEVDGDSHFTEASEQYDQKREEYIQANNIKTIRFTNNDVIENISGVIDFLLEEIETRSKFFEDHPSVPSL